jgi:hypothetical protein
MAARDIRRYTYIASTPDQLEPAAHFSVPRGGQRYSRLTSVDWAAYEIHAPIAVQRGLTKFSANSRLCAEIMEAAERRITQREVAVGETWLGYEIDIVRVIVPIELSL